MMLEYKIDVLAEVKKHGWNTGRIRRENAIGQNAVQKIRRGEMIGIKTLEVLCDLLDMQPGDVIKNTPKKV